MKTTQELVDAFDGMTCRFDGVPFEFEVNYGGGQQAVVFAIELVRTIDGTRHREEDCHRVFNSYSNPHCRWSVATCDWYTLDQLELALENGDVVYCDEADICSESRYTVYCEHSETTEHISDVTHFDGRYYLDSADLLRLDGHGNTFLEGDEEYYYCSGEGEWYHESCCHYCPSSGDHECGEESECEDCQPQSPDRVFSYHRSGISPNIYRDFNGSGFAVGFEVEKNSVMGADSEGDRIPETNLFAYWETDASCGIEGITHAYDPLDPDKVESFRVDVNDARDHVNADCDSTCGGHINISSTNHSPRELMKEFREYAPLWYAVYRHRLVNSYCRNDKKIEHGTDKYSPVITKSFGIELRLPSRVHSCEQLIRRFEWAGETCQAIREGKTFNQYVKSCRQLLLNGAYGTDRMKYARVLRLARKFRVWMLDGVADQSIQQWI
jgi:hypothetical protein